MTPNFQNHDDDHLIRRTGFAQAPRARRGSDRDRLRAGQSCCGGREVAPLCGAMPTTSLRPLAAARPPVKPELDVALEYSIVVDQRRHLSPLAPRTFTHPQLIE